MTTDLPLALTLAIAAIAAGLPASTWRWRWVAGCGVVLGLALGARHPALAGIGSIGLVLVPALAIGARHEGARALPVRAVKLMACGALAVALHRARYGSQFRAAPDGGDCFNRPNSDEIAELDLPGWRAGIDLAERWRLLPRPDLWGLTDTVRTGVHGRSLSRRFVRALVRPQRRRARHRCRARPTSGTHHERTGAQPGSSACAITVSLRNRC